MKRTQGHPSVFTDAQNATLCSALCEHKKAKGLSQHALGAVLGISQQAAGRLLGERAGFSYVTATRLVRALGYAGVDTFFRSRGVLTPSEPPQAKSA